MSTPSTQDTEESLVSQETIQSSLHDHLRQPLSTEPSHKGKNRLYYCQYCPWFGQSTTNVRLHLRKHAITLEAPSRTASQSLHFLYNKASEIDQTSELDTRVMRKILNQKTLNEALVAMIVTQNLPFRIIESPFFRAFCQELNPEAQSLISSHSTLKLRISSSFNLHKDILRKKLQSALSTIHLALDIWTSPNHKLFLGICAQFVDFETEELVKALIALPSIPSHHSEVQHDILFQTLQDFGIYHKIGAFIGDNATSNDKLCLLLDSKFEEEGLYWKASENRIRCTGHIINLAVQAFLFQKDEEEEDFESGFFRNIGPLGKLHNIVIHIRGSVSRTNQFKTLAGRNIPLDNSTRWNSWYEMLRVALEKESALDTYSKAWYEELKSDFLSPQDWEILRFIQSFLKPFYSATKTTEGDHATIDRVLLVMDALVQHYRRSQETFKSNPFISQRIQKSWQTFDKYYAKTEDTPYYAAAILFHPSRKTEYLKYNWEKKWVKPAIQAVKTLWINFKGAENKPQSALLIEKERSQDQNPNPNDDLDTLMRGLENFPRPPSKDELEEYLSEPPRQIEGSSLYWWLRIEQRRRWPKLSQLAINILSIPAMSAEPERVFSGARRTIMWERMRLGESTVEMLECLKHWIRSGLTGEPGCIRERVVEVEAEID